MKRRLIITFDDDDLNAPTALAMTAQIIARGYVSAAAGIPHYCWATFWQLPKYEMLACTKIKSSSASADSIEFIKQQTHQEETHQKETHQEEKEA